MKKIVLFVLLVLYSFSGKAVDCIEPKICTLRASQMCTNQNLKLFGDDECIECGCPDGGEEVEFQSQKICCKDGKKWNENSKSYSGNVVEECGCPEGKNGEKGTFTTKDGESACCFDNKAWNDYYREYVNENVKVCGCPKSKNGDEVFPIDKDGNTACCFENKEWNSYDKDYTTENAEVCGCPKDENGNDVTPTTKDGVTACCFENKAWDSYNNNYTAENVKVCGCPKDKNGNEVTPTTKDGVTACCFENKAWNTLSNDYTAENAKVCGCPKDKNGNEVTPTTKDGVTACCFENKAWDSYALDYTEAYAGVCGCPKDKNGNEVIPTTKDGKTACCFENKAWTSYAQDYTSENAEVCGCPKDKNGNEVIPTTKDGKTACCFENKAWNNYAQDYTTEGVTTCCTNGHVSRYKKYYLRGGNSEPEVLSSYIVRISNACCPEGTEALDGSGVCCTEGKKYKGSFFKKRNFTEPRKFLTGSYLTPYNFDYYECCDDQLFDYKSYNGLDYTNIKQCCANPGTLCSSGERGVVISEGGTCKCGCFNNSDCNQNWQEGDPIYYCQSNHTCQQSLTFDISGMEVEIQDFAGGALTREKIEALVKKVRDDLLASTGNDKVKIVFSGKVADPNLVGNLGYSMMGDNLKIHINSGRCEEKAGVFQCSATIVHENVHRVDNVNQPLWHKTRKQVTRLYQELLTEIHAQARGALTKVRTAMEKCYRYKDGQTYRTCNPFSSLDFNLKDCQECLEVYKSFAWGETYARKYINSSNAALKYYSDISWSQDNNCQGLQAQLEQDFMNSDYAEVSYIKGRRAAAQAMLGMITPQVRDAVHQFKDVSFLNLGFLGMLSRIRFSWNTKPSPALVTDIAKLYSENATLCMTPEEFTNHPKLRLGFESETNINEFEEAFDFVLMNPECKPEPSGDISEACQTKLKCLTSLWRFGCWPVEEWASHIDEIETYTID